MIETRRMFPPAVLLACLVSCGSVPESRFDALIADGQVAFEIAPRPSGDRPCLIRLTVSRQSGETVWELQRRLDQIDRRAPCAPWLPLPYGRATENTAAVVAALPLQPDVLYTIHGGGAGEMIRGAFRIRREGGALAVENVDLASPEAVNAATASRTWRTDEYMDRNAGTTPEPAGQ